MILWYGGAILLGIGFAWLIGFLFSLVLKPGSTGELIKSITSGVQVLLVGEDEDFWPAYKKLMKGLLAYVGRQVGALVLAFAPLVIALLFLGPILMAEWEQGAPWQVFPTTAGGLRTEGSARELVIDGTQHVALPAEPGSIAVCLPDSFSCLVLAGFAFHIVEVPDGIDPANHPVIIRATRNDWNPLWPYLSDPEFLFFLSLTLGSFYFIFTAGKSSASGQDGHEIGFMDNLLTQIATENAAGFKRIGDYETRSSSKKLAGITIDRPVFIAGLARSGTTILLEKFATLEGVGTHRYRDFPFIMAPIYWNRFLNIAGSRQQAAERPHKDGIEITRDSPDAFEEPIWQHFFSGLHDPEKLHVLDTEISNADFEQFYREHLKKILLLRKGQRYVSKGNYNLPRIEYISKIFPDAVFLIPIRHPLTHVQSLVRQQQLFVQYAADDPNSPDYLRAVGHYEFGMQRQPINIAPGCAERTLSAWLAGDEAVGYAIQWAEIYGHVANLLSRSPELSERIRVVRFEDLCAVPEAEFRDLLAFTGLADTEQAATLAAGIQSSKHALKLSAAETAQCWEKVQAVAALYGYTDSPLLSEPFDQAYLSAPVTPG